MIKTEDIYFASYCLSCTLILSSVKLKKNGNVFFVFYGETINEENEIEYAFDEGLCNVNVREFISNISLISNIFYRKKARGK